MRQFNAVAASTFHLTVKFNGKDLSVLSGKKVVKGCEYTYAGFQKGAPGELMRKAKEVFHSENCSKCMEERWERIIAQSIPLSPAEMERMLLATEAYAGGYVYGGENVYPNPEGYSRNAGTVRWANDYHGVNRDKSWALAIMEEGKEVGVKIYNSHIDRGSEETWEWNEARNVWIMVDYCEEAR